MRETKIVTTRAKVVKTPAKKKEVIRVTCDICNKKVDLSLDNRYGSGMSKCAICDRDLCRTHQPGKYYNYTCWDTDPDESGDYPDKFCIICLPLIVPARREMIERHWKEEDDLVAKVKKESLNVKTSTV